MGERAKFFLGLLQSSEMFCSLKYEDMGGCPYNAFTPHGARALAAASAICALASLLMGA